MMRNTMCCLIYIKEKRENEKFIRLFTYYFFYSLLNLLNNLFILDIVRYDPLRASSYLPTPKELQHRGALTNVINRDEKCFLWLVLASVHEARDNPNRVTNYRRFENTINMDGTSYPVKLRDIDRFENLNENKSVNVFAYEEKKIFPARIIKAKGRQHHVNLLVITDNESHHFILIKNLNRLLVRQYKKYNGRLYFCPYCLHRCTSQRVLDNHVYV